MQKRQSVTRTTLPHTSHSIARAVLCAIAFASAVPASACVSINQRPETISFQFERNVSTLTSTDLLRFAHWAADMKAKYPLQWGTVVSAASANYERHPSELATRRSLTIASWATKFGLAKTRIETSIEPTIQLPSGVPERAEDAQSGGLSFIPACPNDCCDALTTDSIKK